MIDKQRMCALLGVFAAFAAQAGLKVEETADGTFSVLRDGVAVATGIRPAMDREVKFERSFQTLKDGTRVWNRWNASKEDDFRFEIAERADGAVEMTMHGFSNGRVANRLRTIAFTMPGEVFDGKAYDANGYMRRYASHSAGKLTGDMKELRIRYLASAGIVFNFDPWSTANFSYDSAQYMTGEWRVKPDGKGGYSAKGVAILPADGSTSVGQKLVIHEGDYADYAKDHFLPYFDIYHYILACRSWTPLHLVKFGAPKAGARYKDGNVAFNGSFGWTAGGARATAVGHPSGAYYSHAAGKGPATYRFGGLHGGWYILTLQLGNYTGEKNVFAVSVNGETLAKGLSVKAREARTVARAYHVSGGTLDVAFDGDWLVSAIGLQPLLADEEDFYMRRGIWLTEGYENSTQFLNAFTRPAKRRAIFDQTTAMPEPGKEASAPYTEPPKPVELVDRMKRENRWMYNLNMRNVNMGASALYYADDAKRAAFLDDSKEKGYNAFMLHGNICRHLMADEQREIVEREVKKMMDGAHARGIKFIDHIDVSLAWALEYGFRALIENLDCAMLDFNDNLPTYLLCFENPRWKQYFYDYLRKQVQAGADGFQLDELCYWRHGCGCAHCRNKFHDETGWSFPLDETDPSCKFAAPTKLNNRWASWQAGNVTNWRIGLRRHVKDIAPGLYMSDYNVYAGQVGRVSTFESFMDSARTMSMLGTEVMQQDIMRCSRPLMSLSRLKNIFRLTYGVPSWNWFYNSNYANEVFAFAVCSMTGEIPLLTGTWLGAYYDPAFADPVKWASASRPMDIAGAFPVAEVGLLFSYRSCKRNEGDNHSPEILGLAQELENMHVPYEFFGDASCRYEQLRNYKVVFLGEAQCLSDDAIQGLKTFLACGGRVYGRPGCGSRNEFGEVRKDPFEGYAEMPSAKPFYEEEHPERGKDKGPWFVCDRAAELKFRDEIAARIRGAEWWKVEGAPEKLYTSVFREASGDIVLHFLNATGCDLWENGRLVALKSKARYPALKEDVLVEVPASCGEKVLAYGPELGNGAKPLEVERKGERLRIRIPKEYLQVYMIVRFR